MMSVMYRLYLSNTIVSCIKEHCMVIKQNTTPPRYEPAKKI